jgi:tripartite-type tricarboxylate transporter receptor subunit TctC
MHMGLAFNAGLYDRLPYDSGKDILPVAYIGATPNVLVVNSAVPVTSVADFLALARANPGSVNYASGGLGSAGHVPMEVLQSATGIKLSHIPYKGSGPAIVDLMSGQVQCMLLTIPAVMPFLQSGKLRAIATSGRVRTPALPNVPTLQEAGVAGFDYTPWYGLFAPAGTPEAVVAALHAVTNKAVLDPSIAASAAKQGLEVQAMTQPQFASLVARDIAGWSRTIRQLGIRGET